jgi:hypothetical protein
VFFVMFKKTQENVQKNRDNVTTKHHLKSDQLKHEKNMAKITLNMDNVYLDVPVLTSPCLVVVHYDVLLHFFFQNVDVQQNVYDFWWHHKKHGFLIVNSSKTLTSALQCHTIWHLSCWIKCKTHLYATICIVVLLWICSMRFTFAMPSTLDLLDQIVITLNIAFNEI